MLNLKMPDVNNIIIAGNLTCDPSFRKTTNGTPVANFFIASNRKFKDNSGQWRENVCYVGVVAWYKLAESCFENLKRGSAIIVDGELQSRNWRNDDGSSHNVVEIKARRIQFLDRKGSSVDDTDFDSYDTNDQSEKVESESGSSIEEERIDVTQEDKQDKDEDASNEFDFGYRNMKF
ncbi:MAG: single-stranded DNA-binding protein [candidate division KSB1 bacterium]|nr:single-stranded DNA-binding protein [candidate division KSB1 bacterium]